MPVDAIDVDGTEVSPAPAPESLEFLPPEAELPWPHSESEWTEWVQSIVDKRVQALIDSRLVELGLIYPLTGRSSARSPSIASRPSHHSSRTSLTDSPTSRPGHQRLEVGSTDTQPGLTEAALSAGGEAGGEAGVQAGISAGMPEAPTGTWELVVKNPPPVGNHPLFPSFQAEQEAVAEAEQFLMQHRQRRLAELASAPGTPAPPPASQRDSPRPASRLGAMPASPAMPACLPAPRPACSAFRPAFRLPAPVPM